MALRIDEPAMLVHALDPSGDGTSVTIELRHRLADGTKTVIATVTLEEDDRGTVSEAIEEEYGFGEGDAVYAIVTEVVGVSGAKDVAVTLNTTELS